ncbi:hypothetical protein [Allorhizobium borbori]|uniref:Uncharacterized protein n=1 Tax=Allorhizobium borbori TaxID=485907 RepID=A0A7W6K566_9HYPH|nr:hypothetical protein [Allorhizobium borbori]MBB4105423.1 hypothetical protein [Allorhizobium borbori]
MLSTDTGAAASPPVANMQDVLVRVGQLNYVWTNTESLLIYVTAHLLKIDKEAAIIIFLTLNTTRARIDLVERLAKRHTVSDADRTAVLSAMGRLKRQAKVRNKYNHSIYSHDGNGRISGTQLMRLVETDRAILYGKEERLDARELRELERAITEIAAISEALWAFIRASDHLRGLV